MPISVKRGTVVKLRESRSGKVTLQKAIVVGTAPPNVNDLRRRVDKQFDRFAQHCVREV
jgi:hypothetical protein